MSANEIKPFNGFNPSLEKPREMLPVGGHICKIVKAKAEDRSDGNQELVIMVEIADGPFANFYRKDFEFQKDFSKYPARYRGIYRIICPTDHLRPEDAWRMDKFNHSLGAILESNPGYKWEWDAGSLAGLSIGISVRENEYRGSVFTEIGKLIPVSTIQEGKFRPMRRRISRDTEPNYVQGYPPVSTNAQKQQTTSQEMIPRADGTSLPQGQGVVTANKNMAAASTLPATYSESDDIPF